VAPALAAGRGVAVAAGGGVRGAGSPGRGARTPRARGPPTAGISTQVRPSSNRPLRFLNTPPYGLKKNGTPAATHRVSAKRRGRKAITSPATPPGAIR